MATKLLLVNSNISATDILADSCLPNVTFLLYDYQVDTYESLIQKIANLGISRFDEVGFIFHGSAYAPTFKLLNSQLVDSLVVSSSLDTWTEFSGLLSTLHTIYAVQTVDLFACDFYSNPDWKYVLNELETQVGIHIRASTDETGNMANGGNWIMESDGTNIQSIYFNENIANYRFTFSFGLITCVITTDGYLYTCGYNFYGQLGLGNNISRQKLTAVSFPDNKKPKYIAYGLYHTCVITTDGYLYTCGYNGTGQLGLGDFLSPNIFTLVSFPDNKTPKYVACGLEYTCVITTDGRLYTCGYNNTGQLGLGNNTNTNIFTAVSFPDNKTPKYVACGFEYTCVITTDGYLYRCGNNLGGQMGLDNTTNQLIFTAVSFPDNKTPKYIACGLEYTCVITTDGRLYTCGRNDYGQLGLGNTTPRLVFTAVSFPDNKTPKYLACGNNHTCVITTDGYLYTCGQNDYGQLGLGNNTNTNIFTLVSLPGAKYIACGAFHTYVITIDGYLYTCGANDSGQLGFDDFIYRNVFTLINNKSLRYAYISDIAVDDAATASTTVITGDLLKLSKYYTFDSQTITDTNLANIASGSYVIDASFGGGSTYTIAGGQVGNGSVFNGLTAQYVNVSSLTPSSNGVSIALWMKTAAAAAPTIKPATLFSFSTSSAGTSTIDCNINITTGYLFNTNINVCDGAWYHIVATYSSNGIYNLYVNNVLVYIGSVNYTVGTTYSFNYINKHANTTTYAPSATTILYDDFRVYNTTLSNTNVQSLYLNSACLYYTFEPNTITASSMVYSPAYYTFAGVSNQYLNVEDATKFALNTGTVECWLKTANAGSGYRNIVVKAEAYGIFLIDNELGVYQWINASNASTINTGIYLNDNSWHHVAFSFQSGVANGSNLYVDGILVKTFTYTILSQTYTFRIASPSNPGGIADKQYFIGSIADVRVWSTVRTSAEIYANKNFNIEPTSTGLEAYYIFNNNNNSVSGISTSLTITGSPILTAANLQITSINVSNIATGLIGYDDSMVINGRGTNTDYKIGSGCVSFTASSSLFKYNIATPTLTIYTSGLSFSYWLKPSASNGAYILNLADFTSGNHIYMYYYGNILRAGYGANSYLDLVTNEFTGNCSWIHIALTISAAGFWSIYLNGTFNNAKQIGYPTTMARMINDNWRAPGFSGMIDEFRMYQRTLSSADVLFLYKYPYYDGIKSGFSTNGIDILDSVQKNTMSPGTVVTIAGSTLRTGLKYFGYLTAKIPDNNANEFYVSNFDVSGANHSGFVQTICNEPNNEPLLFSKTYGFTAAQVIVAKSLQIKGYFKPNISGLWTFKLWGEQIANDDISLLWIGPNALNRRFDNKLIIGLWTVALTGGTNYTTVYLNADTYYPLLLYWVDGGGGFSLSLGIKSPNASGYVYNGIFDGVNCFFNNDDPPASFAGTGTSDDAVTSSSLLNNVQDMVTDSTGNMYIADYGKHIIYKVDATTSIRTVFAGTGVAGYSGDGGSASSAQLNGPYSLTIGPDNNLYVAEFLGDRIRRIVLSNNSVNTISTFAGSSAVARNISSSYNRSFTEFVYNPAVNNYGLALTTGIAINQDATRLIFCRRNDTNTPANNFSISVRANSSSAWSTAFLAISNNQSNDEYIGIAMTADGSRMATIVYNKALLCISNWTGATTTDNSNNYLGYGKLIPQPGITDREYSGLDMTADGSRIVTATFNTANTKGTGQIYFSNWNGTSYPDFTRIDSTTRRDYAGIGVSRDGSRLVCGAANTGVFWAMWNGTTYVNLTQIDFNNYNPYSSASVTSWRTCRFSPDNSIIYISCTRSVSKLCLFYTVYDYVSNNYKGLTIIEPSSDINYASTFDGWPLCISYDGSTIFASTYSTNQSTNQKIYQTDISYNYFPGISGRLATDASLNGPTSIAFDSASNAYIAESTGNRISKVTNSTGQIATYAGYGVSGRGYSGDAVVATSAKINMPMAVEVDSSNNVFFTDSLNSIVRKVDNNGIISTVNGALRVAFSNYNKLFSRDSKYNSTTGMVINNDRNRMVFCSCDTASYLAFYFHTLAADGTWSGPTPFGEILAVYWNGIGMTGDGSRIVISNSNSNTSTGTIYMYTWTGSTYSNQSILTTDIVSNKRYRGVDITADGSRLVTCDTSYNYFATWNSTTYTGFTRIDDSNVRGYAYIRVSKDGSRLVCSGDDQIIYWAKWNSSTNNYTNLIPINYTSTIVYNQWRSFTFSADNNVIFANITKGANATNYTRNRYYFSYDTTLNNYTGPIEINVTAIPTTDPDTSTIHVDGWLLCTDGSGTTLYTGNNSTFPITSTSLTYYNAGTTTNASSTSTSDNAIALIKDVVFGTGINISLSNANLLGYIAINQAETILYCGFIDDSARGIAYYTKINGGWTGPTNIDNPTNPVRKYHFIAVNAEGTRIVALNSNTGIFYLFTFTNNSWSGSVQVTNITANTAYYGLDMTSNGYHIVTCTTTAGYVYFATWTGSTYSALTQIADTTARNYYGVSVSRDGSRLVTATNNATDNSNNGVFWATWNGSTYANLTKINFGSSFPTTIIAWRCCQFSPDNNILFMSSMTSPTDSNRYYSIFDYTSNNYSGCTIISTTAVPLGARNDGVQMCVSYDGKTLYTGNWPATGYISPIYATPLSYTYYPNYSLCYTNKYPMNAIALTNGVFFGAVTDIALSNTFKLIGIAINRDENKLFCCYLSEISVTTVHPTYGIIYYTKTNGAWSSIPTQISGIKRNYHCIAVNADGTRVLAYAYLDNFYLSTYNGTSWSTLSSIGAPRYNFYGMDMTADGNRMVTCALYDSGATIGCTGFIYFATWVGSTYSGLTQIAMTNDERRNYTGIGVSRDGSRLVCGTNDALSTNSGGVFWATWNGSNYVNLTKIIFGTNFPTSINAWRACRFSPDNNIIFMSVGGGSVTTTTNRYYATFDYNLNNYSGFTAISTDAVPVVNRDGWGMCVSYDGKTLYTGNWDNYPVYATALSYTYYPTNALALDSSNNMYVTDTTGQRVSMISSVDGQITTVAGSGSGSGTSIGSGTTTYSTGDGGVASSASLHYATNIKFDANDNLYIADNGTGASVAAGCRVGSSTVVRKMISNAHISSTSSAYMIKNTSNAFDLFQPSTDFKSGVTTNYKINGTDIANLSKPILQNAVPISGYSTALINQLPVRDGIMMHLDACMNVVTTNRVTRWTGSGSTGTSTYAYPNDGLFYYYRFEPSDIQSNWVANMATGYPVYDASGITPYDYQQSVNYEQSGAEIVPNNNYIVLKYQTIGSATFKSNNYTGKIGYLVVGAGGSSNFGGVYTGKVGGRGGDVLYSTISLSTVNVNAGNTYNIGVGRSSTLPDSSTLQDSNFDTIIAKGCSNTTGLGGTGGAGATGGTGGDSNIGNGGKGGDGTQVIITDININQYYGGGGGGGGGSGMYTGAGNGGNGGKGGSGGGGSGRYTIYKSGSPNEIIYGSPGAAGADGGNAGVNATGGNGGNNTGGGAGGQGGSQGGANPTGGSGVVIIYFPKSFTASTPPTTTVFNKTDYVVGSQDLSLNSIFSQYLQLNTPFIGDTNGLTFSCWFKMSSHGNWCRIFDFGNGQGINNIVMAFENINKITIAVTNGSTAVGYYYYLIPSGTFVGNWYHVAWTIGQPSSAVFSIPNTTITSPWTLYINGVSCTLTQHASYTTYAQIYPDMVSRTSNYLGKSSWSADPYFNGQIDDFRTYNRCLTASEVTNLYNKTMYNYAPLYKTNFINNASAIDFGALPNSVLVTPKSTDANTTAATLFFVFQKSAVDITNARASHLLTSYDARSNNGLNIMFSGWNSVPGSLQIEHYNGGTVTGLGCNFVPLNNTPYILTLRFQASTNTLLLYRVNGVDYGVNGSLGTNVFAPTILFSSSSLTINSSQWVIGNYLPDLTRNFYGGIGEFIHYNTALTSSNISSVEQYLSNKWSIGIGITPAISTTTTNSVNSITYQFSAMNAIDVSFVMPVSSWTDTTVGVTARQRINSLRPMYSIKNASTGRYDVSINSLPVINFETSFLTIDSRSGYIDGMSAMCSNVSTNSTLNNSISMTVFIVFQIYTNVIWANEGSITGSAGYTAVGSSQILFASSTSCPFNIEICSDQRKTASLSKKLSIYIYNGTGTDTTYATDTVISLNTPYILMVNVDSPNAATNSTSSYKINGVPIGIRYAHGQQFYKTDVIHCIGNDGDTRSNRNLKGVIGEIAYYNRTLSATEITKVENYLSKKWQIAIGSSPTISPVSDYGSITPAYQITPLTGQVTTYNGKTYIATASSVASSVSQPFNVFNRGLTFDCSTSTWDSGYAGRNGYRQNPYSAVGYYQDPSFNNATTLYSSSLEESYTILGLATNDFANATDVIVACYSIGLITGTRTSGTWTWTKITPITVSINSASVTATDIRYITLSSDGKRGAFIENSSKYICWFNSWDNYTIAPSPIIALTGITLLDSYWTGIDMTPSGTRLVACSSDGKLATSINTGGSFGALTAIIPDIPRGLYLQGIAITYDGKRIAVGSNQSGIVYVFDLLDQATNTDANAYTSIVGGGVVIAPGTPYTIYPGVPITFVPAAPTSSYITIKLNDTYIIPYGTSKTLTMNGTSNNYTTQTISTGIYWFRNLRFGRQTTTDAGPKLFISTSADNMYYCVYNSTVSRYSDPIQIPDVAVPISPATTRDTYGLAISYDNNKMYTCNWSSNIIYATDISTIASYSTAYSLLGPSSSESSSQSSSQSSPSSSAIVSGEWIQIQLPYQLMLKNYSMLQNLVVSRIVNTIDINPYNEPTNWCVVGSNDGSNWTLVHSCSDTPMISGSLRSFTPTALSSEFYSYFRLVVNKIWPNTQASDIYHRLSMCQWNLYGVYKYTDSLVPLLTNYGMPQQIVPVPGATFKSNVLNYNNKTYIASASSYSTANVSTYTYFFPYLAFNNVLYNNSMYESTLSLTNKSTNVFWSAAADYGPNYSGDKKTIYFDNTNVATSILGEWIQMQLSFSVLLTQYSFVQRSNLQIPGKFYIMGSNDGITWFLLDYVDNSSLNHANYPTFFNRLYTIAPNTFTNNYYTYFRMVVNTVYGSFTNMCSMYQLSLIGIPM